MKKFFCALLLMTAVVGGGKTFAQFNNNIGFLVIGYKLARCSKSLLISVHKLIGETEVTNISDSSGFTLFTLLNNFCDKWIYME
ncbi:MAG: hypothetical protein IPP46_08650 [Bacteroidetes bacterium]|nr:hypothetical protein [Bacteroidota bacterium]